MTDNKVTNNPKQSKKEQKAAKAAIVKQQKINTKIVNLESKKTELEKKLKSTSNPSKKADLKLKIKEVDKKIEKLKDPSKNRSAKLVLQTWSKGLAKETSRITWETRKDVFKDFVTIVVVCVILAVIFFLLDLILVTIRR